MRLTILILSLAFLTGCSLWPKRVEYFQDKVKLVPEESAAHQEIRKEAARYISEKTAQTSIAAIRENSSTNVIIPSLEANIVALVFLETSCSANKNYCICNRKLCNIAKTLWKNKLKP